MKFLITSFIMILFFGCATSSGVLKTGVNTYNVSANTSPIMGGYNGAKKMAYKEARAYCLSLNKQIFVIKHNTHRTTNAGAARTELDFQCK